MSIEIVVSRYNETLNWLSKKPYCNYPVTIYNKGLNNDFKKTNKIKKIVSLNNVGRCDHTYLYHIINNYDNLEDITIFLPGSVHIHYKNIIGIKVIYAVEQTHDTYFYLYVDDIYKAFCNFKLDEYCSSYKTNIDHDQLFILADIRPFGKWFISHFGEMKVNYHAYYGIFAVHKRHILQHPIDYYKNLIKELEVSSNLEVGHYFERAWGAIFGPLDNINSTKYLSNIPYSFYNNTPRNIEIIISRYNEDLHWIDDLLFDPVDKITIYNKGINNNFIVTEKVKKVVNVENVGRCHHTYLYHIINNYDNLSNFLIFIPGSMENDNKWNSIINIFELLKYGYDDIFPISNNDSTIYQDNKDFYLEEWKSNNIENCELNNETKLTLSLDRPYKKWYEKHFKDKKYYKMSYKNIFALSKEYILQFPITYYQELIKELEVSNNTEVGHFYERSWSAIFNVPDNFYTYLK